MLVWVGRDEISEGDFAAFTPMETSFVIDGIFDKPGYSRIESFLLSPRIKASKSFGGKRWGFKLSKDIFKVMSGINCEFISGINC